MNSHALDAPVRRICWAIDPFEREVPLDRDTLRDVGRWAKSKSIDIEPVFVFTPITDIEKMAMASIVDRIQRYFADYGLSTLKPRLLVRPLESSKSQAMVLLDHAVDSKADLVVVSSHGRHGFPRLMFGSFAESLLEASPLPLLFLNQNPRPTGAHLQAMLWATDFSKTCEVAFRAFLRQAHGLCDKLWLYHDVSLPLELSLYFGQWDVGIPAATELIENQKIWARQQSGGWLELARREGFPVEAIVEPAHGSVGREILATARTKAIGLVVMASQSGPLRSMVLGSHAREVFRASEFPVWVYGTQFIENAKKKMERELGIFPDFNKQTGS